MIGIFNRSHYESVLVERVHKLVPEEVWKPRYEQINSFERLLSDEGTTIIKFFLHISWEEQKRRMEARLADPTKNWKFSASDLKERAVGTITRTRTRTRCRSALPSMRRGMSSRATISGSATLLCRTSLFER